MIYITSAVIITWLVLFVLAWLAWQFLRQNGRMLLRLDELEKRLDALEFGEPSGQASLPLDSPAPEFDLPDLAGERKSVAQFRGQPLLLVFFNPACGFCRELAPKLAACTRPTDTLSHSMGEGPSLSGSPDDSLPQIVLISTGDAEANRQFFAEHKLNCPVLLQEQMEAATVYRAHGTPSGYLISREGTIASELAMGADALLALASGAHPQPSTRHPQQPESHNGNGRENRFKERSLARSKLKRDGLKAGTTAPEFRLPLLGDGELSLSELHGRPVVLVFSSPTCGPCNTLAPKLQKFHRKHPEYELVMISRGEPEQTRQKVEEHGLTFPVVLQQQWEISRLYAMFATPVAYLINPAGVIVADVAVGVDAIINLMGGAKHLLRERQATQELATA